MGFFSDYEAAKKKAEEEFERNHPILAALSKSNTNNKKADNRKRQDLNKRMNTMGLFEDERRAVREEGYDPEDFEDDEIEEDDYYSDEF